MKCVGILDLSQNDIDRAEKQGFEVVKGELLKHPKVKGLYSQCKIKSNSVIKVVLFLSTIGELGDLYSDVELEDLYVWEDK
jgi:hypothetical protein